MHESPRPDDNPTTADPADTADETTDAFLVASRALVGMAAASLADSGDITLLQFRGLVRLSDAGVESVGALATALDVHHSTATRLCDRLVRKGLIKRAQGRDDRRATEVSLTAAGRRLVDKVTRRRRRAIAAVVSRMSERERTQAVRSLLAFAEAAGEPAPADVFGWVIDDATGGAGDPAVGSGADPGPSPS